MILGVAFVSVIPLSCKWGWSTSIYVVFPVQEGQNAINCSTVRRPMKRRLLETVPLVRICAYQLFFLFGKRKGEQDANHNTKQHETEATRQQENVDSKLSTWKLVTKEAAGFTEIWRVTNRNDFCMWQIFFWTPGPNLQPKVPPQCWHSSLHTLYVGKFAELHCHDPWSTWPDQAAGPTVQ